MIEVRPLLPFDLAVIGPRAAEPWVRERFMGDAYIGPAFVEFSTLADHPHASTAIIDGMPVAAGGFFDQGQGNAIAWSLLAGDIAPHHFTPLVRAFRRAMLATPFKRIEAHCIETVPQLARWVQCLGFQPGERCLTPDGKEFRMFVFRNNRNGN